MHILALPFSGSTGTASDTQNFAGTQPTVSLKQPPKPKVAEPQKPVQQNNPEITSPKRKTGEPVNTNSEKAGNQSVTVKPPAKLTSTSENSASNKSDKNVELDKNGVTVTDKNSKDLLDVEPRSESKDQLATPKKERFIPPLPKSSSK